MDAGNFPTYEKIINTTPLPRTRQENGWFYLELSFSPDAKTRSQPCAMRLEFGTFGDVCLVEIAGWREKLSPGARDALQVQLMNLKPTATYAYDNSQDTVRIGLMNNKPAREKKVEGLLIFDGNGALVCLASSLK